MITGVHNTYKITIYFYIFFSTGNSSQPIWLDNVQCFNSSTSCLADCETCPSSEYHDCVHSEDITIECCELYTHILTNWIET